jgi:hypothetical protein
MLMQSRLCIICYEYYLHRRANVCLYGKRGCCTPYPTKFHSWFQYYDKAKTTLHFSLINPPWSQTSILSWIILEVIDHVTNTNIFWCHTDILDICKGNEHLHCKEIPFMYCISFLGIARPQSQFPHSCVCEWFIYSQDQSTYFPAAE